MKTMGNNFVWSYIIKYGLGQVEIKSNDHGVPHGFLRKKVKDSGIHSCLVSEEKLCYNAR